MAGRVNEIFGLGTLAAKVDALNQLATDVFEAREDPIHLTRALPQIFQSIFSNSDGSTYVPSSLQLCDRTALSIRKTEN